MKQVQDIRHMLSSKKYIIMLFAALVFVSCILFMSDIFSYSRSSETAGNKLTVSRGAVQIKEPNWDDFGQKMAKHSEPGMLIPKNPYAVNDGNVDLYIRLKMTIDTSSYTPKNTTYEANFPDNEAKRVAAILKAIKLEDNSALINDTSTNNPNFIMDTPEENGKTVYYFYYVENNTTTMKSVSPGGQTAELFSYLEIPIYKKDYLGVFDQKFDIILEAEGIPVGKNSEMTLTEETKNLFKN